MKKEVTKEEVMKEIFYFIFVNNVKEKKRVINYIKEKYSEHISAVYCYKIIDECLLKIEQSINNSPSIFPEREKDLLINDGENEIPLRKIGTVKEKEE